MSSVECRVCERDRTVKRARYSRQNTSEFGFRPEGDVGAEHAAEVDREREVERPLPERELFIDNLLVRIHLIIEMTLVGMILDDFSGDDFS